ncbi:MAG: hypothetical protein J6Q34_08165 [Bacteroidales bacterium]|nr:hypothetical protein [Bacteroidales bacterium]
MKKLFSVLLFLVVVVSCQKTELLDVMQDVVDSGIYASIETLEATKTSMDENYNVLWSDEDQIVAFMKTTLGSRYQIKEQYVGTTTGAFSKVAEGSSDDLESGQEIDHNVVLYPYSTDVWCMKNDSYSPTRSYKLNVVLPQTQHYAEKSFADGAFPMLAVSSSNQLTFRNICGGVKLQFKGVDKIKSIELEGLAGELISGKSTVVGYVDGSAPSITMNSSKAAKTVVLDCGDGVQLDENVPVVFILAVPPVEFSRGMKITVTDTDGLSRTLTNSSRNKVSRSSLLSFPVITYRQEGVFELPDGALTSYEVVSDGGVIEIPVVTNQEYEVVVPEGAGGWIGFTGTKVMKEETIVLEIAANNTSEARYADVIIADMEGVTLQVITICQKGGNMMPTNPDEFALVDLGLSVKWANYNMGASSVSGLGTSSTWGHEEGKDVSYPKDMNISGSGDDLVKKGLGGNWRLPTAFDFLELEQKCSWKSVTIDGVSGNLVTGPNGNSIFLPNVVYWTGTARERSTEDHDYLYGIVWTPEGSLLSSGKFNRPVQGAVRVYPEVGITAGEIGTNSAKVVVKIEGYDNFGVDLDVRLKISGSSSYWVDGIVSNGGECVFNVTGLGSGNNYNIYAGYNVMGWNVSCDTRCSMSTLPAVDGAGVEASPIDLGLSVKWAEWNLGASCRNDRGVKLVWGGRSVDDEFDYSIVSMDITGTQYDPATALWGPEWRLPTMAEWNELVGKSYSTERYVNADGGVVLQNRIFLPQDLYGVSNYMSGVYGYGCYFLLDAYVYASSFLSGGSSKMCVRPVYDPLPQLDGVSVSGIGVSSAFLYSDVVRIGGGDVVEKGFVYSTQEDPTLESSYVVANDRFVAELTGLQGGTEYFVRAYAKNAYGTSYGKEFSFTTVIASDGVVEN